MTLHAGARRYPLINHAAALILPLLLLHTAESRSIVADAQKVRAFLGNKDAKVSYISGGELFLIDLARSPLAEAGLGKYSGLALRPRLSFDGTRVAFSAGGKYYVRRLEAGAPVKEIGSGGGEEGGCTWWVQQSTGKVFVLFPKTGAGIMVREVSSDGTPVGQEQLLFAIAEADGGRSADGRFLGSIGQAQNADGTYRGHGIYEFATPYGGAANLTLKTYHQTTEMGYCNGTMSVAGPGHKFYGCVLALGGGHVRLEFYKFKTIGGPFAYLPAPFLVSDSARAYFPGRTEFHGMGWSTHPGYVATSVLINRTSKGLDDVYLCNVNVLDSLRRAGVPSPQVAAAAFVQITSGGGQSPHLWIDGTEELLDTRPVDRGPGIGGRVAMKLRLHGNVLMTPGPVPGFCELRLSDCAGRRLVTAVSHSGHPRIDMSGLPPGTYSAELLGSGTGRTATLFSLTR